MTKHFWKLTGLCGLGVMLSLSSCGGNKKAGGQAKAGGTPKPSAATTPAKKQPVWQKVENPVEPALAYSDRLLLSGDYERAATLLAGLKEQYPEAALPPEYDERLKRVQGLPEVDKALSPNLAGFAKNDGASFATVRDAGDDGLVILRKQIMANSDDAIMTATIDYMVSKDDAPSAVTLLHRWKKGSSSTMEAKLLDGLKKLISKHSQKHEALDGTFLENMLLVLVSERSDTRRAALRGVLSAWNVKAIDQSVLQGYRDRILADKTYDDIHLIELMASIYSDHCGRDSKRFDELFGMPTHDLMVSYLNPAIGGSVRSISTIAQEIGPKLGLPDLNALKSDLALHYPFNSATKSGYIHDPRTTKVCSKLLNGLSEKSLQEGLEGRALKFNGKERLSLSKTSFFFKDKERKYVSRAAVGSYTISVWVKPKLYPTKSECKKSPFAIVSSEAEIFGLYLSRDESVLMIHPLEDAKKPCVAKSTRKVPAGKWTHLVSVVDRSNGTVKIYVNGVEDGSGSFPANARPANSFIAKKFMLGSPGSYANMGMDGTGGTYQYDDNAFVGMVDELRIYAKALSSDEVKQVYQIHASLAQ